MKSSGKQCEPDGPSWVAVVIRTEGPVASSLGPWEYPVCRRKERVKQMEKEVRNRKVYKVFHFCQF